MRGTGYQPPDRCQLFRQHHLGLQPFEIVIGVLRVSEKMRETAIKQLLAREDKNGNHQHRGKAEHDAKTTNFRRILQPLKREQSDCRYAGRRNARDPFWNRKPNLGLFSVFTRLKVQLARVKANPGDVGNGDSERKIPQSATGVTALLNKDIDDCGRRSVDQKADQIVIVDLLPRAGTVLRKIKQADDGRSKLRMIEQVEIAMERACFVVQHLPDKRELEVQIHPPARDEGEFKPACDRRSILSGAMR